MENGHSLHNDEEWTLLVKSEGGPPQNVTVESKWPLRLAGPDRWLGYSLAPGEPKPGVADTGTRLDNRLTAKRYPAVGKCIYCHATSYSTTRRELGLEHIIPEALGGKLLLPKASCEACERMINSFETFCAKVVFEDLRYSIGITGKRGKVRRSKRRISDKVAFWRNGIAELVEVPIKDMPRRIMVPAPQVPGMMHPNPTDPSNIHRYAYYNFYDTNEIALFLKKHEAQDVAINVNTIKIRHYMRVIAKIAHSFAVAQLGIEGFQPILTPFIMGEETFDASFVMGTSRIRWTGPDRHFISLTKELHHGVNVWVCKLQLFTDFGLPEYVAVVGTADQRDLERFNDLKKPLETNWKIPSGDIANRFIEWAGNSIIVNPGPENADEIPMRLAWATGEHAAELQELLNTAHSRQPTIK
jgi:hypothetical protein